MRKSKFQFIIIICIIFFTLTAGAKTKRPTEKEFLEIIRSQGIAKAVKIFQEVRQKNPKAVIFKQHALNKLGLKYLDDGKIKPAIEILKLNTMAYPKAFNTYDSLAKAYMFLGDKQLAIKNYKKSVQLNPGNKRGQRYAYVLKHYTKNEYMIPMRDGVKLYTQVYTPNNSKEKYPILLKRTPYSIGYYEPNNYNDRLGPNHLHAVEGFIFAYQDVRGKYKSEGEFVVLKPYKPNKESARDTDESSDTYDTTDWLLKHIANHNGRVGQWGISYPAWQTVMGMIDAHPALKASSPQASPSDMFIGDDFHHNGAFRLMYTFSWLAGSARPRKDPTAKHPPRFDYGTSDGYQFFLDIGPLANVNKKYFHNEIPTWNQYMEHGNYDEYWQKQEALQHLDNINHPVLNVAGWFDAEDFYGPMSIYYTLEKKNPDNKSTLVVGPWLHGGWARMNGDSLGKIQFGEKTGVYFREKVELPFFVYHLKNKGKLDLPEALVFETGSNQWKSYDQWPPKTTVEKNLYFHAHEKLSFSPPKKKSGKACDTYTSDPDNPVPWSTRKQTRQGHLWMVEDQRFAAKRPDVLVYQSRVLTRDITIAGPIIASLYISTTGTDADWIVKLIDVYPNTPRWKQSNSTDDKMSGYQMLLAGEVFRGKFRNSFEKPEPMVPNQVTEIKFDLRDKCHCFLKGHRIMVQIQSTWFPVIDRNPQKFVDIYHAKKEDFQKADHKVYRSKKFPSHLKIKIMK